MPDFAIRPLPEIDTEIRQRWSGLVDTRALNPSLLPGWTDVAAQSIGNAGEEVHVYVESHGVAALTAAIPFFRSTTRVAGLRLPTLRLASNRISYHAEIVSAAEPRESLVRFLERAAPWDVLHAGNLDVDGPTAQAIRAFAAETGTSVQTIPGDVSPYLPIDCSWEAYLGQKDKKFRYKLRQRRKFVEQDPRCRLTWYRDPTDAERLLADIVQIEARSWKARAGIDIPSNPVELQYHRVLLPFLAQQGWLDANVLYIEDQPAAYNLCCSYKGWVGQLKTSFDEKFAELSPGTAVIDASIERAFAQQAREFDFLGDAGGHKLAWTSHTRTHADYFLYAPRLRPRLIGWLKTLKNRFRPSSDARRSISRGD